MLQSVISEHITITSETLAKQGIPGQNKEKQNNDKSTFHLSRQHLPKHHGRKRPHPPGSPVAPRQPVRDRLRCDQPWAKGVHRLKVIFKHALKNALIPVVTYVGPMVAYILTGSMVVENIFTIGGLGTEFVTSIVNRDYTMIMAITIFLAVLMVVANLLTDIAYKLIDPRITFE